MVPETGLFVLGVRFEGPSSPYTRCFLNWLSSGHLWDSCTAAARTPQAGILCPPLMAFTPSLTLLPPSPILGAADRGLYLCGLAGGQWGSPRPL